VLTDTRANAVRWDVKRGGEMGSERGSETGRRGSIKGLKQGCVRPHTGSQQTGGRSGGLELQKAGHCRQTDCSCKHTDCRHAKQLTWWWWRRRRGPGGRPLCRWHWQREDADHCSFSVHLTAAAAGSGRQQKQGGSRIRPQQDQAAARLRVGHMLLLKTGLETECSTA
jgi:hypothetical protein